MQTEKVRTIESVSLELLKGMPHSLEIIAKGENTNSNYSKIRLEPYIYVKPPADGIWEFSMVGDVPPITDQLMTHVEAKYVWERVPEGVKGVKVYGATNSKTATLHHPVNA